MQEDFNLLDAFQMIDYNNKGYITCPEIIQAMVSFSSQMPDKESAYLFVRRYDRN